MDGDSDTKLPVMKLLRINKQWEWDEEQHQAIEALRKKITEASVLSTPDFNKLFMYSVVQVIMQLEQY